MKPEDVTSWVAALSSLINLGVPLAKLIVFVKGVLSAADADAVLRQLLFGWQAAKTENDARILELQAQIGQ